MEMNCKLERIAEADTKGNHLFVKQGIQLCLDAGTDPGIILN
jgi:hypothetical protein